MRYRMQNDALDRILIRISVVHSVVKNVVNYNTNLEINK